MLIWRFIKAIFQRLIRGFSSSSTPGNYSGLLKFYCFLIFLVSCLGPDPVEGRNLQADKLRRLLARLLLVGEKCE